MSLKMWIRAASNFIPLIPSRSIRLMIVIFFWSWILKACIEVQEKKKKVFVFSRPPQNVIFNFHVVVVQWPEWRQSIVQKSVITLLLFCLSRPNAVCRSRWCRRRRCLSSLKIQGTSLKKWIFAVLVLSRLFLPTYFVKCRLPNWS